MSEIRPPVRQAPSGTGIWDHFTMRDGLPDMKIECVFEDSRSVIWIGTHDRGVVRYEGDEFRSYTSRDGLAADGVFSVVEDDDGVLWFGTNRGLITFDGEDFTHIEGDEPFGLLWGSAVDKRGYVWLSLLICTTSSPPCSVNYGRQVSHSILADRATMQRESPSSEHSKDYLRTSSVA